MLDSINTDFKKRLDKYGKYPADMNYSVTETKNGFELCIEDASKGGNVWKCADPWGFAAFDAVHKFLNAPLSLRFAMRAPSGKEVPQYEALKRRLS